VRALTANSGNPALSVRRTGGAQAVGPGCGVEHRNHLCDGVRQVQRDRPVASLDLNADRDVAPPRRRYDSRHYPEPGSAAKSRRHASSHRRHTSAQMRQCSWRSACSSHSSAHATQEARQLSTAARVTAKSIAVRRDRIVVVAAHTSEQSRSVRMHLINETMSGSAMQASAHAAQAWKQATHSSMHLINSSSKVDGSAPKQRGPGWDSAICLTTSGKVKSFRPSTQVTDRAAAATDRSDERVGRRHFS
jgi:hypothetical protein